MSQLTHPRMRSYEPTHSPTLSRMRSYEPTHSPTLSRTHSLTHSVTHTLTHPLCHTHTHSLAKRRMHQARETVSRIEVEAVLELNQELENRSKMVLMRACQGAMGSAGVLTSLHHRYQLSDRLIHKHTCSPCCSVGLIHSLQRMRFIVHASGWNICSPNWSWKP